MTSNASPDSKDVKNHLKRPRDAVFLNPGVISTTEGSNSGGVSKPKKAKKSKKKDKVEKGASPLLQPTVTVPNASASPPALPQVPPSVASPLPLAQLPINFSTLMPLPFKETTASVPETQAPVLVPPTILNSGYAPKFEIPSPLSNGSGHSPSGTPSPGLGVVANGLGVLKGGAGSLGGVGALLLGGGGGFPTSSLTAGGSASFVWPGIQAIVEGYKVFNQGKQV